MVIAGKLFYKLNLFPLRLHQGAYSCAQDLCYNKGISKLMQYCKNKLEMMIDAGVRPLLVFDGNILNMKRGTEDDRYK